jgi:AmpE protein
MKLIVILICLAIQRYANINGSFSQSWFEIYLGWLKPLFAKLNKWLSLAAIILPVLVVLFLINLLLTWRLFDLFGIVFAALVLFLCIEAQDFRHILAPYLEDKAETHDAEARAPIRNLAEEFDESVPHESPALHRTITKLIFLKASQDMFMVLFWFMIFGIYGAAGYYIIKLTSKFAPRLQGHYETIGNAAITLQNILDWVPTRILGISYALAGNFSQGFTYCYKHLALGLQENKTFAVNSGLSALDITQETEPDIKENINAINLIDRTIIVWLISILLITIGMLL